MTVSKSDVFEDIARSVDWWTSTVSATLTTPESDLRRVVDRDSYRKVREAIVNSGVHVDALRAVLSEVLRGFAVSTLTMIDGGTVLAEKGRVYLVNEDGDSLGEGLHEGFVAHLFDSGRLA